MRLPGSLVAENWYKNLAERQWNGMAGNGLNVKGKKNHGDEYENEVRLQSQFLAIYRIVNELGLRFMFDNPRDCNLTLVREFMLIS